MAKWLDVWTCNPEVPFSSPLSDHWLFTMENGICCPLFTHYELLIAEEK